MLLRILIWGIVSVVLPVSGGYAILAFDTFNTIVPGVSIDGTSLSGKTVTEAEKIIAQKAAFYEYGKITIVHDGTAWSTTPHDLGVTFDTDTTAQNTYAIGRSNNVVENVIARANALVSGKTISLVAQIDESLFTAYTDTAFGHLDHPAINAALQFDETEHRFAATEAQIGTIVNKSKLKYDLLQTALRASERIISIAMQTDDPLITAPMLADTVSKANELYEHAPITLEHITPSGEILTTPSGRKYQITKEQLKDILTTTYRNAEAHIDARPDVIRDFLVQIAPSINTKPRNATLTVQNGRAKEFAISKSGIDLDIEKSTERILEGIRNGNTSITLVVTETLPEIRTETIENLGLVALIGKGESDFSGSPASRIFNIKLGAEKMNGVLIKPGEEFSFMKTIGEVGAKEGYQFAMVIKNGGDLVREYGGGLCQVSTTMFRAAVYSGLPVLERSPHSLPVSYYNPQGFDAAVYSPHPDLRFKNDTPSNILVQTKIIGSKLYFEFYGTPDGRETKVIGPVEYDKKPDGSLKAKLTQEIYKDDTLIAKKVFTSSYRSPHKEAVQKNPLE